MTFVKHSWKNDLRTTVPNSCLKESTKEASSSMEQFLKEMFLKIYFESFDTRLKISAFT